MALTRTYEMRRLDEEQPEEPIAPISSAHQCGGHSLEEKLGFLEESPDMALKKTRFEAPRDSDISATQGRGQSAKSSGFDVNNISQLQLPDDIEHLEDSNEMIENVLTSLSNMSEELTLQEELIGNGILEVVRKYLHQCIEVVSRKQLEEEAAGQQDGTQLLAVLPSGSLNLMKAISVIMLNFSWEPSTQLLSIENGIPDLILTALVNLNDYEIQTNMYKAIGNFCVSGLPTTQNDEQSGKCAEVRQAAANAGFIQVLVDTVE